MSELQKELEESLQEIKVIKEVARFVNLLISFKKLFEETKQKKITLPHTFRYPHTDFANLLDNLKSLFKPTHDFSKNVIGKNILDHSEKVTPGSKVRARAQAQCLVVNSSDDLRYPTCSESFSKNPIKKKCLDNLKKQDDFTDAFVETRGSDGYELDDLRLQTCSEDFSENPIKKGSLDNLKKQDDFTVVFPETQGSDGYKLEDLILQTLSEKFSENPVEKGFLYSTEVKNLDKLKHLINPIDAFSENVIEKTAFDDLIRLRLPNYYIFKKTIEKKLLDLLLIPDQNRHTFSAALSKLIYHLYYAERRSLRKPLNTIIKITETVISESSKYCKYNSRPPFHKDTESLNVLKIGLCIINQSSDAKADEILNLILRIGSSHSDFTKTDQKLIGNLMINAIDPIQLYIKSVFRTYRSRSSSSILRKKSALQIIFDDYAKFTSEDAEYQKVKNSIEILNKINKNWCDDSDDSESDLESGYVSDMSKEHA